MSTFTCNKPSLLRVLYRPSRVPPCSLVRHVFAYWQLANDYLPQLSVARHPWHMKHLQSDWGSCSVGRARDCHGTRNIESERGIGASWTGLSLLATVTFLICSISNSQCRMLPSQPTIWSLLPRVELTTPKRMECHLRRSCCWHTRDETSRQILESMR